MLGKCDKTKELCRKQKTFKNGHFPPEARSNLCSHLRAGRQKSSVAGHGLRQGTAEEGPECGRLTTAGGGLGSAACVCQAGGSRPYVAGGLRSHTSRQRDGAPGGGLVSREPTLHSIQISTWLSPEWVKMSWSLPHAIPSQRPTLQREPLQTRGARLADCAVKEGARSGRADTTRQSRPPLCQNQVASEQSFLSREQNRSIVTHEGRAEASSVRTTRRGGTVASVASPGNSQL